MAVESRSFEVGQPAHAVYERWLHYESLGEFAPQVKSVCKTGERTSHWVVEALGMRQEWDAEVTALEPDRRIAWRSLTGPEHRGEVLFEALGPDRTRVTLNIEHQLPEELAGERIAAELAQAEAGVRGTLERQPALK
jgi:uncharacterized membrane protein